MKENLVIREKPGRFTLRVTGKWYRSRSYQDAIQILQCANLNAHRMIAEAIIVPDPVDVEYKPLGRRSWLVNGKPQSVAVVRYLLSESGCDKETIATILRAERFVYEFNQWLQSLKHNKPLVLSGV